MSNPDYSPLTCDSFVAALLGTRRLALAIPVDHHRAPFGIGRRHRARTQQIGRIGDLRGQIVLLRAAEIGVVQCARLIGQVGGPVAAIGRLGDVAQIGEADGRARIAPAAVGLHGDRALREAELPDHLAQIGGRPHGGALVRRAARHGDDELAVAAVHAAIARQGNRRPGRPGRRTAQAHRWAPGWSRSRAAATPGSDAAARDRRASSRRHGRRSLPTPCTRPGRQRQADTER